MVWLVAAVLAVAVAVAGIALVRRGPTPAERRREASDLAEVFAVRLSSYDYRHFDADFRRVVALSTGNFRSQYQQALAGDQFRKALASNQAVATAKVVDGPFAASVREDEARMFTIVEQRISGKNAKPQVRRTRVETIMIRTVKGWRVDRVEIS